MQTKTASVLPSGSHAPPTTKYGGNGWAQNKKVCTSVLTPPVVCVSSKRAVIQAKVPFSFFQWSGSQHAIAAGAKDFLARISTYHKTYVKDEIDRTDQLVSKIIVDAHSPGRFAVDDYIYKKTVFESECAKVAAVMKRFATLLKTEDSGLMAVLNPVLQLERALHALVNALNIVQGYIPSKQLEKSSRRYSRDGPDVWNTNRSALECLNGLAHNSDLPVKQAKKIAAGVPSIPGIKWSLALMGLPKALVHLIDDLHRAHAMDIAIDERNNVQISPEVRDKSPNQPGALRSWHWNEQGALPGLQIPAGFHSSLHDAYSRHSQAPFNGTSNYSGPIGYAEYTGTGIRDDMDQCKLVYDYVNGIMYITVTHYQRYDVVNGQYVIKDKISGSQSGWFYIDFNR